MADLRERLNGFIESRLWSVQEGSASGVSGRGVGPKGFIVKTLRLIYVGVLEFLSGQLTLQAMSLVYTTLLSIVPLLAVSFSVLKAFGVHNQVEPLLSNFLMPFGPKGVEISSKIILFVENIRAGVLGSIGLAVLLYTVISLIQKIEASFNYIWKVTRPRSLARTFSDYMSVLLVGPVLIFSAIGLTASVKSTTVVRRLMEVEPFGSAFYYSGKVLPYLLVCAAFTFIYIFVPSTKVRFKSALAGGVFAGLLWETAGWTFASFVVSSTRYAAIYSGFAILIMFMIWLYLSWLILLVGAGVAYYHQYPQFLSVKGERLLLSGRLREGLALTIMSLIGRNFRHGGQGWTLETLVERLGLPFELVHSVLEVLEDRGLLIEAGSEPPAYMPARALEFITLKEVIDCMRMLQGESENNEGGGKKSRRISHEAYENRLGVPEAREVVLEIEAAIGDTLGQRTLKDLVDGMKDDRPEADSPKAKEKAEGQ